MLKGHFKGVAKSQLPQILSAEISTEHKIIQCSSEISKPKYTHKTRIIHIFIYMQTGIDIFAYAYVSLVCMC